MGYWRATRAGWLSVGAAAVSEPGRGGEYTSTEEGRGPPWSYRPHSHAASWHVTVLCRNGLGRIDEVAPSWQVVRPPTFPAVTALVVHRAVIAPLVLPAVPPEVATQLLSHDVGESKPDSERRLRDCLAGSCAGLRDEEDVTGVHMARTWLHARAPASTTINSSGHGGCCSGNAGSSISQINMRFLGYASPQGRGNDSMKLDAARRKSGLDSYRRRSTRRGHRRRARRIAQPIAWSRRSPAPREDESVEPSRRFVLSRPRSPRA